MPVEILKWQQELNGFSGKKRNQFRNVLLVKQILSSKIVLPTYLSLKFLLLFVTSNQATESNTNHPINKQYMPIKHALNCHRHHQSINHDHIYHQHHQKWFMSKTSWGKSPKIPGRLDVLPNARRFQDL